jgi:AcrR family transcriptional regulator
MIRIWNSGSDCKMLPALPTNSATRPLRRDAARNRARILDAARDCFSASGAETQIADVARHAGVGVGTVYRHFPSREALAEALALTCVEHLLAAAEEALAAPDPGQGFATWVRAVASLHTSDRAYSEVLGTRANCLPLAQRGGDLAQAATRLAARAQAAGALRDDLPAETLARLVRGLGLAVEAARIDPAFDVNAFVDVFLRGMAPNHPTGAARAGPSTASP